LVRKTCLYNLIRWIGVWGKGGIPVKKGESSQHRKRSRPKGEGRLSDLLTVRTQSQTGVREQRGGDVLTGRTSGGMELRCIEGGWGAASSSRAKFALGRPEGGGIRRVRATSGEKSAEGASWNRIARLVKIKGGSKVERQVCKKTEYFTD